MSDHQAIMTSPIGRIGLRLDDMDRLVALDFLGQRGRSRPPSTLAGRRIVAALLGYFADPSLPFTISLVPVGTPFQQRVWAALREIPPGTTCSYGELAHLLDSAPRAVGQACRHNPIPIIIPCHRVVARDGAGGYSGATARPELDIKRWLLAHEGVFSAT
jgi:methylated-DNA-[protein]-cysteine S-methyltransferase